MKLVGNGDVTWDATGAAGIVAAAEGALAPQRLPGFHRMPAAEPPRVGARRQARSFGLPGPEDDHAQIERSSAFRAFLRGYFDADGSVQGSQAKGVSVRLTQSDCGGPRSRAAHAAAVRHRVDDLPRVPRRARAGWPWRAQALRPAGHELVVSGDNLRVFADRVGFSDTAEAARLRRPRELPARLNRERFVATVESLVEDGCEDVYDVTVADVHAFDANGLVRAQLR